MEFVQIFLGMAKGSALFGKAFLGCAIYRNGRIFLKRLILINGTMGAGKTAVCRELERELAPCAFLDGDWCWEMHPFQVTDETKRIVWKISVLCWDSFCDAVPMKQCFFVG